MAANPLAWKRECVWRDESALDLDFAPTLDDVYASYRWFCIEQNSDPWFDYSEVLKFRRYIGVWGIKFRPRPADNALVAPGWRVSGQKVGVKPKVKRRKQAVPDTVVLNPNGTWTRVAADEDDEDTNEGW